MDRDNNGVYKARGQYPATGKVNKEFFKWLERNHPCGTKRVNSCGQDRSILIVGVASLIVIINNQDNIWCFGLTAGDNCGQRDAGQTIFRLFCQSSEIKMTQVLVLQHM